VGVTKNLLDGEHEEQSLQWSGQQCQQQPTDEATPSYSEPADVGSTSDAQSAAVEPAGSPATTTTTTSIQAWRILKNSPYHFLTS
jgi:hypothetical protein